MQALFSTPPKSYFTSTRFPNTPENYAIEHARSPKDNCTGYKPTDLGHADGLSIGCIAYINSIGKLGSALLRVRTLDKGEMRVRTFADAILEKVWFLVLTS